MSGGLHKTGGQIDGENSGGSERADFGGHGKAFAIRRQGEAFAEGNGSWVTRHGVGTEEGTRVGVRCLRILYPDDTY